ncbi:hypothetical protein D3C86_2213820 [compost metagenome]
MRIEKVRCFHELRRRNACGQIDDAVLNIAILHHKDGKRTGRLKPYEFDMFKRAFGLGRKHKTRAA